MENLKRARSWKRRLRPRVNLKNDEPVLYSTHWPIAIELKLHRSIPGPRGNSLISLAHIGSMKRPFAEERAGVLDCISPTR